MSKAAKKAKNLQRERRERVFLPRPTANSAAVLAAGALGSVALGAGSWAQWGRVVLGNATESLSYGWWVLSGGAVISGVAIWFGTSGEPVLRVGDGGVVMEKGGFFGNEPARRVPWHQIDSVTYDGASNAIVVKGRDEAGGDLAIRASLEAHPQAAAWIVGEARARVPAVVDVSEQAGLPEARDNAGAMVTLEPVQVVGKRCADTGKIIAFEPDARVCPRCERVYHKDHVPDECACGGSLAAPRDEKPAEPSAPVAEL
jgi:hypothetical protein